MYTAGTSYKKVLEDITLTESEEDEATFGKLKSQTYHLKPGSFLVIPHATMQTDPRLRTNPTTFDPDRILVADDEAAEMVRADMRHLNAFGGDHTMCKSRFFPEREVLTFIAAFVSLWDIKRVDGKSAMPAKYYNGPIRKVVFKSRSREDLFDAYNEYWLSSESLPNVLSCSASITGLQR